MGCGYGAGVAHPSAAVTRLYLDAGSAAPLHPAARQALMAALDDGWADPRRLHAEGRRARMLLDGARQAVATVLGARPEEVSFTSSHTSALFVGVLGALAGRARVGRRLVVSAVEHSAVLQAGQWHAAGGGEVAQVEVSRTGRVDPAELTGHAAVPGTALLALQSANGEVGTLQPVEEVHAAAREAGVPLLVDAGASLGHAPPPSAWDLLAADAHAWGGPSGVGVLAVRTGVRWRAPFPADEAELGRFPGEVDIPSVLAAAVALQAVEAERDVEAARRRALVDVVRRRVAAEVPDTQVVGDGEHRLPHVVTFSCLFVDGEAVVGELDRLGFAVGSGSACTASTLAPSHVLAAMGVLTHGNVRLALPVGVDERGVTAFCDALPAAVARVRAMLGVTHL